MGTIKMFRGTTPPLLKKGEWASDGHYAYLGMEHGEYKVFQGVFDLSDNQFISGFQYDINQKAILIPSGTPFSKLQSLFDTLPKALKYTSDSKASIDIMFEDGTYINDLGTFLVLRDFSYQINIKSLSNKVDGVVGTYVKPVIFQSDKAIEIYNSAVNFEDIRFEYSDENAGAIAFLNSTTYINDCCFDAQVSQACVSDRGYNNIVFSEAYFKLKQDIEDTILDKGSVGSFINIARSKSAPDFRPKSIVKSLSGALIIAGNVEDLHIAEKSPIYLPNGGIEVHGGFIADVDGGMGIAVPTKISQLENDLNFTSDYQELENTPPTITPEQATAIENNNLKNTYPQEDAEKLAGIEEGATAGADWETNVQKKPTTITAEQATAIEANTLKNSYPQVDAEKLTGIEDGATAGADWNTNLQNLPVTISSQQASDIETNNQKRSYPQADEDKLIGIEETATVGADWETNVQNRPTTISTEQVAAIEANAQKRSYPQTDEDKLAGIEASATVGADWETNVQNKPTTITLEQAEAIDTNTQKVSYPRADADKLASIEEGATVGADWETSVQNKPITISAEQAAAIEANAQKRSYPQADEDKLEAIEDGATAGADWETNVANKPTKLSDFENDLEPVQATEVDWSAIQNIPAVLVEFINSLQSDGVTHFDIIEDGTVLRLGHIDD